MTAAPSGAGGPLRIVYMGPVPPYQGGIAQHGARLVAALRRLGHFVAVISWAALYPPRLYPGDVQRDPDAEPLVGTFYELRWWNPLTWVRAGWVARRADLFVLPWITPLQAVAVRVAVAVAGPTPIVAIVHNPVPHEPVPLSDPLTRFGLAGVDGVVAHAPDVVRVLHELGVDIPATVVGHPPNLPITPGPLPPRPPLRLLFLGFVRRYKGVDVAIRALGELRARGVEARLTVAGQIWQDRSELDALITDVGVTDVVELLDRYVPDEEVSGLLAGHHVVVAPYRSATQSGIAPLAAAAGRPIVATRVGGLAEQVTSGVTGELVPPEDPPALADAIEGVRDTLEAYTTAADTADDWGDVAAAVLSLLDGADDDR